MTSSRSWRKAGFAEIRVHSRELVSVDDLTLYPLFTDELIGLMQTLIEQDRQGAVATAIVPHGEARASRFLTQLVRAHGRGSGSGVRIGSS